VVIDTASPDQKVTLEGNFKDVVVQSEGKVDLAANTTVQTMEPTVKSEITVASGSSIGTLDSGQTGTVVSGSGGLVNGQPMGTIPSTPSTPSTPSGGNGGNGGGHGNSGDNSAAPKIATFAINGQQLVTVNGTSATLDLSSSPK